MAQPACAPGEGDDDLPIHCQPRLSSLIYWRDYRSFLGDSLIIGSGEHWRRQRRLTQPAFSHHHLEEYSQVVRYPTPKGGGLSLSYLRSLRR